MALIKVTDLAYGRLRAPDLDLAEEFLTHFGMAQGGADDRTRSTCAGRTPPTTST